MPIGGRHVLAGAVAAVFCTAAGAADYLWTTGDFATTGIPDTVPGDTLTIAAGGAKRFVGGSFTNAGRVNWLEDTLQGGNSASVLNQGVWEAAGDSTVLAHTFGGAPTFTNTGTLRKNAGAGQTTVGGWLFVNNGGTIDAQAGRIVFNGGSTRFNAGSAFRGAGVVGIEANAVFNDTFRSDNLFLAAGEFSGGSATFASGVAAAAGRLDWTGGDFAGTWSFGAGNSVVVTGASAKRQVGGAIVNNATVLWNSSVAFQGGNSGSFTNNGVFEAQTTASLTHTFGGRNTITNSATGIVRASGSATLTVGAVSLVSEGGEFNAAAGSAILYSGGVAQFNDGTRFTGPGTHTVNNDARFVGTFHTGNLAFAGGTQSGGTGAAGSNALLQGPLGWTGGDLQGAWEIKAGSVLTATGMGSKRQVGGSIVNNGTVLWNADASFQGGNSGSFTNNGVFEAQTSASLTHTFGGRNTITNAASGVVRASAGATLTVGGVSLVSDGGEFNAAAGSAILYSGGVAQFNEGTRFTGAGTHTVNNDARFVGTFHTGNLAFAGGTQFGGNGAGTKASLQGPLNWIVGDLQGTWENKAGSVLTASGTSMNSKRQVGGSIVNDGTVLWNSEASFQGGNSGSFTNNGLFEAQASASVMHTFGGRNTLTNAATGVVRASGGATLTIGAVALVSDGGEFNAATGSAIFYSGGVAQFNEGTRFTGPGTHTVNNDARYVGTFHAGNLVFAAGSQVGGAPGPGPNAILQGTLGWSGGDVQGAWEINSGSVVTATGAGNKRQVGGSIVNNGTVLWRADAAFQGGNSASFTNNGLVDIGTDADFVHAFGGTSAFVNNGRLVKSAGAGDSSLATIALTNPGVIEVRSGSVSLPANFNNAGTLAGTGTFALSGTLTNAGHIAPGASPGILTLNGNLVQTSAGVFDVEFGPGGAHDELLVNGTAMLNGTLALHCFSACSLAAGETVVVLDATGVLLGEFAAVTLTGFGRGGFGAPVYDRIENRVLLTVTESLAPIPEPETYVLMLTGIGMIAWAIRRKQRRTARRYS